jgi:ketosteroid isomerase-like protein
MTASNKDLMNRFVERYQIAGDETVLHELVADDFVNRTPMVPDPPGGPVEVKQIFDMLHGGLAGFDVEVLDQLAEDDKVMTYKLFRGRHTGPLFGVPPTGRDVEFAVMDIVRIRNGQIVEHASIVDQAALMAQLQAATDDVALVGASSA